MKNTFLCTLFLGMTMLLTTSCNKDKDAELLPEPAPQAETAYQRSFYYPATSTRRDTSYTTAALQATAAQNATELAISIGTAARTEGLSFTLERQVLKTGVVGTYSLKTLPTTSAGEARVGYYYQLPEAEGSGSYLYSSGTHRFTGSLEITGYDARRRLLSGRYTVALPNVYDPNTFINTYDRARCNITLTGTFDNLLVRE